MSNDESNMPHTRDEHSCVILHDTMVVCGGFAFGERTNEIFKYHIKTNLWEKVPSVTAESKMPCPRAGHSAVIKYDEVNGDCMYMFGGKDDENNKLCDTWKFNFSTKVWSEIDAIDEPPTARSGHTA